MTDTEKIDLLDAMECRELTAEDFSHIFALSRDPDPFVRSRCAAVLVNGEGEEAHRLLLHLANDPDAFVRTEAYDSLALFPSRETELLLSHSIYPEDDDLAVSYAILSWADVTAALHDEYSTQIAFVHQLLNDAEFSDCHSECFYALCRFGESGALQNLLSLLDDPDDTVRCRVCNLCKDLAEEENILQIGAAVRLLLQTEEAAAVLSAAQSLLERLNEMQRKEETT